MAWYHTVFRVLSLGLYVASARSAKVRRYRGRVQNWLDLVREVEAMYDQQGRTPLERSKLQKEFGLSDRETSELIGQLQQHGTDGYVWPGSKDGAGN